ncbi:MAG: SIS domain-containing protein [Simkania sp.]|nr:SIS domain-containing protein [Simkania sp.]
MMNFASNYLKNVIDIASLIDTQLIECLVSDLCDLKEREGRLFFLGVGGSAANCSHAVNDFRKLCDIEAYTPVDNMSELTARTNDDGWSTVFSSWLATSRANENDAIFIFSVGGGDEINNVSLNIVSAIDEAKKRGLKVYGIVGRQGGYTKKLGDIVIVVPTVNPVYVTPHAEAFQAILWHCIVSHPRLQCSPAKWESLMQGAVCS